MRLSYPPKYLILSADLLSDLGNQLVQLTLMDLLIFRGERAVSNLLMMCLLEQAPSILLSPFAGMWIDRVGGRRWLIPVNLGRCLLAGLLLFTSSPWLLFPAYLFLIIGSLFFQIGRLSLTPMVIPGAELISFNSLNERVSLAGRIFGPWLIGWIVLQGGPGVTFGMAGVLFAASAFSIYGLPGNQLAVGHQSQLRKGGLRTLFSEYLRPFHASSVLRSSFRIFGLTLVAGGILNFGLPVFYRTNLGRDISDWGLILSGFQAGSCLATFLLPPCSSRFSHRSILSFTFLVTGGAMALLGHLATPVQLALLMALLGCGLTLMHILLESLIQQNTPRTHMGKTVSLLSSYRGGCYLGTILSSAVVLKIWDPQSLFLAGSLIMVSASLLSSLDRSSEPIPFKEKIKTFRP